MRLLLDTHTFLWFQSGDRRLSAKARQAIEADGNDLLISAASIWEMAIKTSLGRLTLDLPLEDYIAEKRAQGFLTLPVSPDHAARVASLPWHHRDPFDRLLAAQALVEGCPLVTRDRVLRKYGVEVIW